MPILEQFSDDYGSVIFGWLDERVLYARFSRAITTELARRFARRFGCIVGDVDAVRYFCDYSGLEAYDVSAFTIAFDALLGKRDQFQLITMLPWRTRTRSSARVLLDTLGCIEYVASASLFEERLRTVAPTARLGDVTMLVAPIETADDRRTPRPPALAASLPSPEVTPSAYTYVFELGDFETGRFTATRYAHLSKRPSGAWICVARSDEHALALAREAASIEWAAPTTRRPEDFSVRFLDGRASLDRRR